MARAIRSAASGATLPLMHTLEMYKPADQRRWGYFALPVLHKDRLVGVLDAIVNRTASVLRVHAIHEDVKFTRPMANAVRAELADLASWLGLTEVATPGARGPSSPGGAEAAAG